MNLNLFKGKSKRTKIFTAITLSSIVLLILLNFLLTYFGAKYTAFIDMTPEDLYTISDAMEDECDGIFSELKNDSEHKKIKMTFCTDPDYLIASEITRLSYFMALKLQNKYPDFFEVEAVNVSLNPTAVAKYKATSLATIKSNHVIVSYGDRYRVTTAQKFWQKGTTEDTDYYNGEYRLATLMKSVTAVSQPSAYFLTDHGETYYDPQNPESAMSVSMSAFADLLFERGLNIKTLNLSEADRVPEDCVLLIINNPTKDFTYDEDKLNSISYVSDTEKLDRYLVMKQGSIMVAKGYDVKLPVFENFMYEWGFKFSDSVVVDKESSLDDENDTATHLVAKYSTDPESFAYAIYGDFADLSSAPLTVIPNAGSVECSYNETKYKFEAGSTRAIRQYASFLTTSNTASRYMKDPVTGEITTTVDGAPGKYDLAAVSARADIDPTTGESVYSYIFCVNSADFFADSTLGISSRANYDIVSAVIENISKIDEYGSSSLGGESPNSESQGGKMIIPMTMSATDKTLYSNKYVGNGYLVIKQNHAITLGAIIGYSIFIFAVPLALAVVGIVVSVKRRYM